MVDESSVLHEEITRLCRAGHACVMLETVEEDFAQMHVREAAHALDARVWAWSASRGLRDGLLEGGDVVKDTEHPAAAMFHLLGLDGRHVVIAAELLSHLDDARTLRAVRELVLRFEGATAATNTGRAQRGSLPVEGGHLVMIEPGGSDVPGALEHSVVRVQVPRPGENELDSLVRDTLRRFHRDVRAIEARVSDGDFRAIVRNLRGLTRRQAERVVRELVVDDGLLDEHDVKHVLDAKRALLGGGGVLEVVDAPTDLSQIGGMRRRKDWLEKRRGAFSEEASTFGIDPPRGVLMLGVQGTGKSLCAKAIATAWQRPLLRLDAGSLYDKFVGESERKLRAALEQAEGMAPVILWIDEIEKAFAGAARESNDGGLGRRMFGALLTWMQEHKAPVFLVATANDIDALPPELLRKGRFDEIFFVDLPRLDVRAEIIRIHLAKRDKMHDGIDLARLAQVSEGFSAAELEQAVVSAMHGAFERVRMGKPAGEALLTTAMIEEAIVSSPPLSVTASEKIAALQAWAQDRCVPAD